MRFQPHSALLCFLVVSCGDAVAPLGQSFPGERTGDSPSTSTSTSTSTSPSPLTSQDAAVEVDGASSGNQATEAGTPMGSASGLPCDAQQQLATDCISGPLGDAAAPNDVYATSLVCTSGKTSDVEEGETMRPGETCIGCHKQEGEGPLYAIAGTVYPTAHEPDSCEGSSARATVEITDKNGVKRTLTANEVGNFFFEGTLALPYTATVTYQGRTRAKVTPQSIGDCNSCHTQDGSNGAPGRVLLP